MIESDFSDCQPEAAIAREILKTLSDPQRELEWPKLRETLRALRFKSLLAALPLEGIDLTREDDLGRDVDL